MGNLGTGRHGKPLRADVTFMLRRYQVALDDGDGLAAGAALLSLGHMHQLRGKVGKAKECFLHAGDSEHAEVRAGSYYRLGVLELAQKCPTAARRWLDAAIESNHSECAPLAQWAYGDLEALVGNFDGARRRYSWAVETQHPTAAPNALMSLGILEAKLGNRDDATWWLRAARATPNHAVAARAEKLLDKPPKQARLRRLTRE